MMDTNVLWIRAEGSLRAGRHADAQVYLRQLVQVVERIDFEYEEWLRAFAESLRASGQWGEALACLASHDLPTFSGWRAGRDFDALTVSFDPR